MAPVLLPPSTPQCSTHCLQPPLPSTGWEEAPPLVFSWKSPVQRGCNYKGESYISGQCLHPASKQCFPHGDSVLTALVLSQAAAGRLRAKSWREKAATFFLGSAPARTHQEFPNQAQASALLWPHQTQNTELKRHIPELPAPSRQPPQGILPWLQ